MTWHSPKGDHHNQIDYILVKKRFRSCVNFPRTRSFPGADIGSDHDLLMMTFRVHLKQVIKRRATRIRFNLEKLKDPTVQESFQAMIGGSFAPLLIMKDTEGEDLDEITNAFSTAVNDSAMKLLGKHRHKK